MACKENYANEFLQIIKIYFRMVDIETWRVRVGLLCGGRQKRSHDGNRTVKSPIENMYTFAVGFLVVRMLVEKFFCLVLGRIKCKKKYEGNY